MKRRSLTPSFLAAFQRGELQPLLAAVQSDDTLCLELRGHSVNLYYRGGNLFRISDKGGTFLVEFDTRYCAYSALRLEPVLSASQAARMIPQDKQDMDDWFHGHPKYEREFQQINLRENNRGKIARGTVYYTADIEYADSARHARFDMVAVKWPSNPSARRVAKGLSLALLEVKYGDLALGGSSGVEKHLQDFSYFLQDTDYVAEFKQDMAQVFHQKCMLGLIDGIQEKSSAISFSDAPPEIIFVFANHKPGSQKLRQVLERVDPAAYPFPIYIASASSMGYGLYCETMRPLEQCLPTL